MATFDFVPYRFGCFSFQSYADLRAMNTVGKMVTTDSDCATLDKGWFSQLKADDRTILQQVKREVGTLTGDALAHKVYRESPYFAIKSEIAERILTRDEQALVDLQCPLEIAPAWFTLGYEGRNLDAYLDAMVQRNITHLVDVRKNAVSMKQPGVALVPCRRFKLLNKLTC